MQKIVDELKDVKKGVNMAQIKKKLRTLQSQISREKIKIRNSKRSGCGTDEVYESTLWCFNELSFLINMNDTVPSTSNLDLSQLGFCTEIEDATKVEEDTMAKKKKKRNSPEKIKKHTINVLEKASHILEKHNQSPSKAKDFCNYLCGILEKIKLEETLIDATIDILSVVKNHIKAENEKLQSSGSQEGTDNIIATQSTPILVPRTSVSTSPLRLTTFTPISPVLYTTSTTTSNCPSSGTTSTYSSSYELENKNLGNKKIDVFDVKVIKSENLSNNKKDTLQLAFEQTFTESDKDSYYNDVF